MTSGSVRPEAREILTVSGILWEEMSYGNKHNAVYNNHRPAQHYTDQILWLWSINTSSLSRSHVIPWWHTSQASDCKWDPWSGFGSAPWPLVWRVLWRKAQIFSDLFSLIKFLCTNCHLTETNHQILCQAEKENIVFQPTPASTFILEFAFCTNLTKRIINDVERCW